MADKKNKLKDLLIALDRKVLFSFIGVAVVLIIIYTGAVFYKTSLVLKQEKEKAEKAAKVNKEYPLDAFFVEAEVVRVDGSDIFLYKEGVDAVLKTDPETKFYDSRGYESDISALKEGMAIKIYFKDEKVKAVRYGDEEDI